MKKVLSYLAVLCIGAAIGTAFNQKHEIKEKTVNEDWVNTVVREIITERPDGTKITKRQTSKDEKTKQVKNKSESIPVKKDWGVGVKYDLFRPEPVYTLEVHRRVFSDLYVSGYGRTDGTMGVGVTFFF